jgi:hypothetical protein
MTVEQELRAAEICPALETALARMERAESMLAHALATHAPSDEEDVAAFRAIERQIALAFDLADSAAGDGANRAAQPARNAAAAPPTTAGGAST